MLEIKNIYKTYRTKNGVTHRALNNVSLSFEDKGLVFIVGKSGGGKTTLMNILGALDRADRGEILLDGNSFNAFKNEDYDLYRNTHIGVVYQEYNLIPTLKVKENVALPLRLQNEYSEERLNWALDALKICDLTERLPHQLSGGQSQRVAIARAIVKNPRIILADEPTGNIDLNSGRNVMNIFKTLSAEKLVIIVTHDRDLAEELGDRIIEISDGRVVKDLVKVNHAICEKVEIVGRTLLKVPGNSEISENVLSEVNEILYNNDRDSYLIRETDLQKVKSLNQQIKGAVEINPNNTETYFTQYRKVPVEKKEIVFKKVRMPAKAGFMIALSTFKYKKLKLIVTILMLTASLFFGGLLANMSMFSRKQAIITTLNKDKATVVSVSKNNPFMENSLFSDEDITNIEKYTSGVARGYRMNLQLQNLTTKNAFIPLSGRSGVTTFSGFVESDDLSKLGFQYIFGNTSPTELTDIAITQFMAGQLITTKYFSDLEDTAKHDKLLGRKILLNDDYYTITAIVHNNSFDKLFPDKDIRGTDTDRLQEAEKENTLTRIYCRDGFLKKFKNNKSFFQTKFQLYNDTSTFNIQSISTESKLADAVISPLEIEGDFSADAIYLSRKSYSFIFNDTDSPVDNSNQLTQKARDNLVAFNAGGMSGALKLPTKENNISHIFNGLQIKGLFTSPIFDNDYSGDYKNYTNNLVLVSNELFENYTTKYLTNDVLMIKIGDSKAQTRKLINYCEKSNYNILSFVSEAYSNVLFDNPTAKTIFTYIFFISMGIACMLMYGFVQTSIKMESKQVGILRGLGARGRDTYVIFAIEGALMTTVALILSLIIHSFMPALGASNNFYAYNCHVYTWLFHPAMPFILIGMGILMTALGTIIPLFKLTKMSPMDAIYKGNTPK